ncbi:hypothetical protein TI39_contig4170g00008 [Zymoseptoria brevis]|uniref:Uncharacterized protein n=1 Tax=Zymoseptoria brevis TaxID=1047168 RepID=A0A0F4GB78_9PEZI|nr:hypothetical protein TI39_contig4170g00008 [Zymoseptoria brevis]
MAHANTFRIILGALVSLQLLASSVTAQNCYYPNGDLSKVDAPCTSDGGMCCAVGWECLSNGLCYLEAEDYTERRSCTDQSWGDDCSQFCITGASVIGNEAIQQCSDGHWCCDADRHQSTPYCCDSKNASLVIDVPDGRQIGFISSLYPPSSTAPSSRSTRQSSSATSDSSSVSTSSPPSTSTTPTQTTITRLDTTSDSNGQATTITSLITSVPSPTSTSAVSPTSRSSSSSGPKTLTIIIAVIVPVVVLSLLALAYILYRRHKRNKPAQLALAPPEMVNMYRDPDATPELNGDFPTTGAGGGAIDNKIERKSELYGSTPAGEGGRGGYAIHQHSPAVSSLTNSHGTNRNSAATDPPLYSPVSGIQQSPPLGGAGAGNAGNTPMLPQVQEEQAHELWGGDWPGRMMYAPSPPPQVLQPGYTAYRATLPTEDGPKANLVGGQGGEVAGKGEPVGQGEESGEVKPKDY